MTAAEVERLRTQAWFTRRLAVVLFRTAEDVDAALDAGNIDRAIDASLRGTMEAAELQAEAVASASRGPQ